MEIPARYAARKFHGWLFVPLADGIAAVCPVCEEHVIAVSGPSGTPARVIATPFLDRVLDHDYAHDRVLADNRWPSAELTVPASSMAAVGETGVIE